MQNFNAMISKKLKAYVYALSDPRKSGPLRNRIFYIGKGNGNRCFNHANAERGLGDSPLDEHQHKLGTIRKIHDSKQEVEIWIVAHGMTDAAAFALEAVLIPLVGDANAVAGHGDQLLWLNESRIQELYDRPIERREVELFRGNVLVVSLNQQKTDALVQKGMEDELEEATLGAWNVSENRSKIVDCIIGVKYGLVVSIFKIEKTKENTAIFHRYRPGKPRGHGRSRFFGNRAYELEKALVGRSIHDGDQILSKIRPGAGCQFVPALD